ncbi:hypothetical protein [Couchioplanes caeruleus]|uniref:hypothetical protein n=1 Tax=Couchioplanes caeruleus TaxID=56438 RepID=UPI0011606FB9|nr:hypothetical protein [Couchioplanes caeruleus]
MIRPTTGSPHTYERASYLRSLLLLAPEEPRNTIYLLDCEADVRLLAVRNTALTDDALRWLAELRDGLVEHSHLKAAATERLHTP